MISMIGYPNLCPCYFLQILALIATICAAITIKELNFPDFSRDELENPTIRSIENTRIQTRVACAFVFIIAIATLGLQALNIFITILNFGIIQQYPMVLLIIVSEAFALKNLMRAQ